MLEIKRISTYYGRIHILKAVSVSVDSGRITAILGANGAGKTTLLKSVSGLLRPKSGNILFNGQDITSLSPEKIVALGISQVPEARQLFGALSVFNNLRLGAYVRYGKENRRGIHEDMDFPVRDLPHPEKTSQGEKASSLSGGEQQMLAIARAMMSRPKMLLLDEPSLGLAPLVVEEIFREIIKLQKGGTTVLLVEQNARIGLEVSHYAYVLETGRVLLDGPSFHPG